MAGCPAPKARRAAGTHDRRPGIRPGPQTTGPQMPGAQMPGAQAVAPGSHRPSPGPFFAAAVPFAA